ncbi:MAG: hypothetical protein DMF53_11555 [Acidobacteria bacterium]|nr:MAG: hypothetical protein DMF53_11555 [Acidobacteriota bacterium]
MTIEARLVNREWKTCILLPPRSGVDRSPLGQPDPGEAAFDTGSQQGQAQAVKLTDETGYLWFFSATNVELVVKVLDACSFNQRFWVFAGGLTNVRVTLTVTDMAKGDRENLQQPAGHPLPADPGYGGVRDV